MIAEWVRTGTIQIGTPIPPLSLLILSIPNKVFAYDIIKGAVIVNVLLGLGIIYLIMVIVYIITSSKSIMLFLGLIVATHPSLVHYSCNLLRENSYLFFLCLSIMYTIRFVKTSFYYNILYAVVFASLSIFSRHEGFEVLVILLFICALSGSKSNRLFRITGCILMAFFSTISIALFLLLFGVPFNYYIEYWKLFYNYF